MRPQGNRRNNRRQGHGGGGGGGHQGNSGGGHQGGHQGGPRQPRSAMSLRNQIFDSNGPDTRVRGNAFQVHEKYLALAKDAVSSGDRVLAENYLQHAEHYYRIIEAINEATASEQRARQATYAPQGGDQPGQPGQQQGNGYYSNVSDMAAAPGQTPLASLNAPGTEEGDMQADAEDDDAETAPASGPVAAAGRR